MMKKLPAIALITTILLSTSCSVEDRDSFRQAFRLKPYTHTDRKISEFITEAANTRRLYIERGELARRKAFFGHTRSYAERLIKEQNKLLRDLQVLAASKNIAMPNAVSDKPDESTRQLEALEGEAFDNTFVRIMRRDHRRDMQAFENAAHITDRDVRKFANTYLPLLQAYAIRTDSIKQRQKLQLSESPASTGER